MNLPRPGQNVAFAGKERKVTITMQERRMLAAGDESTGVTAIIGFVTSTSRREVVEELEEGTPSESFCKRLQNIFG